MNENNRGKIYISWKVPWIAGILFTLGFVIRHVKEHPIPTGVDQIIFWLLLFFAWPMLLGYAVLE